MESEQYDFVIGAARIKSLNPITRTYRALLICISFSHVTGMILDVQMDGICGLTSRFIQDIMVGHSIYTEYENILKQIEYRYCGGSKIMIAIAVKDAYNKIKSRRQKMSPM